MLYFFLKNVILLIISKIIKVYTPFGKRKGSKGKKLCWNIETDI